MNYMLPIMDVILHSENFFDLFENVSHLGQFS